MNKKTYIIIGIFILAAAAVAAILFLRGDEDTWLCQNGRWVKHGNPSAPIPTKGCSIISSSPTPSTQTQDQIQVSEPAPNSVIKSPFKISGQARGNWFFEASAPVKLFDVLGNQLAAGIISATEDWMTTDFVPFKGELMFSATATSTGVLIFNNDNPSDLPQNSREFRVPIVIAPSVVLTKVKTYFGNSNLDPQNSCNKVFAVNRDIPKTQSPARAALEELLKGLSDSEKAQGFFTSINTGVKIQKLTIVNGVATVDFDEALEQAVGGSCRVAAIRAQITETLKQFSTVKSVVISINGRTEDILQP
jgi:hypothetical protein